MGFRLRLFILPIIGLALFAGESYRSFRWQWKTLKQEGACFCWGGAGLDMNPMDKSYGMFGRRNLTACEALTDLNAYTDFGCGRAPLTVHLLAFTALPAFLVSFGIVKVFAKLGVSEVTTFIVATPPLIFAWYYLVSRMGARLISRRKRSKLATDH